MASASQITVRGNVVDEMPRLNFTGSGDAVASFRVAATPRYQDRQTKEWRDGETMFYRVSVWRRPAENVVESLRMGVEVVVIGTLKMSNYTTDGGEVRTSLDITAEDVLIPLTRQRATVEKVRRTQPQAAAPQAAPQAAAQMAQQPAPGVAPQAAPQAAYQQPAPVGPPAPPPVSSSPAPVPEYAGPPVGF